MKLQVLKIGLSSMVGFGVTMALSVTPVEASEAHTHPDSNTHPHHHDAFVLPEGASVPKLSLDIDPDPMGGWNLQIVTENFAFEPETVNETRHANGGHAHLYLNGEKLTRLYSNWYYIDELPPGQHVLTVSLNTNRHEVLTQNGEPIEASIVVNVP